MADIKTVTRTYGNFRGVDFTNSIVNLYRSPDAVNMWKNYEVGDGIETRPGMTLLKKFNNKIFGLFFYSVNNQNISIAHVGTKLYKIGYDGNDEVIFEGMNPAYSQSFVFNNILFIKDGLNYLEYDGETCKPVEGTIPITRMGATPEGAMYSDDIDYIYQDANVLTNLRKSGFVADGKSKDYHLETTDLDPASIYTMEAIVNGNKLVEALDFTVDRKNGIVTFNTAPTKPSDDGDTNVIITYSKSNTEYKKRILQSTILTEFDNRIFFSGNKDYPNTVFHSELQDPRYVRDTSYYTVGLDLAPVKAMIPGNDILWIFKETNQNSANAYYMTPTVDSVEGKIYPVVSGTISTGCVSTGINFGDDIVFFSKNGLEGIGNTLGSDQVLKHRSSLVDSKLLKCPGYNDIKLVEHKGYLICLVDNKAFLADGRNMFQNTNGNVEYEWFYWEFPVDVCYITEKDGILFLGGPEGEIYILDGQNDLDDGIYSKWTTTQDTFGYDSYRKITNKRGGTANIKLMNNNDIKLTTHTEIRSNEIGTYSDSKGYIVYRVKEKKFKWIQLEFSSNKPFGLFSCTIEAFVAGYVKR